MARPPVVNFRDNRPVSTITIGAIQILRLRFFLKRSRYATIQRGIGEDCALCPGDGGVVQNIKRFRFEITANTPSC
jgi:hypothetical protein